MGVMRGWLVLGLGEGAGGGRSWAGDVVAIDYDSYAIEGAYSGWRWGGVGGPVGELCRRVWFGSVGYMYLDDIEQHVDIRVYQGRGLGGIGRVGSFCFQHLPPLEEVKRRRRGGGGLEVGGGRHGGGEVELMAPPHQRTSLSGKEERESPEKRPIKVPKLEGGVRWGVLVRCIQCHGG
ncbi:hypothetical protein Tco_0158538 [Tanacetum coccineum]